MTFKQNEGWILNKTIKEVGNITKAATFKSFPHLSYKNTQLLFFETVLFNIFMRQILSDDFWGLHKNINCAFPLRLQDLFLFVFINKIVMLTYY